jgi:ubiquinone biosynthesis accessory factor UbiK
MNMVTPVSPIKIFEEFGNKVSEMLAATPAKDVEKNLKALMTSAFTRMDLVTREEFDIQRELLVRTRERLIELEAKVAALEAAKAADASPES